MESFSQDINEILGEIDDSERQAAELIASFQSRFDKVLQKFIATKATPIKPTKKKPKGRIEKMDSLEDSFSSTNSTQSRTTVDAASSNRTTVDSNVAANTRSTTNETLTDDSTLLRPVRTGRARQPQSYKEPPLNTKMRRDNTEVVTKIKTERPSVAPSTTSSDRASVASEKVKPPAETKRVTRIKKEKTDVESSAAKSSPVEVANGTAINRNSQNGLNDSIEIVPMDTCPPIELSDDENRGDVDKMPPPAFVPSKPAKEKKAPAEKKIRSTRSKQTKRKVKQEPASESEDEAVSNTRVDETKSSSETFEVDTTQAATELPKPAKPVEPPVVAEKAKSSRGRNVSGESAYEDAVADPMSQLPLSQQSDATFVTTTDENEPLSPRGTYIIPHESNDTFNVAKATTSKTTVASKAKQATKTKVSANSIMTDDDSDTESLYQKKLNLKKKDPKELFNPCASNPIRQRVEAFEKLQTPQKETRTKRLVGADTDRSVKSTLQKAMSSTDLGSKHTRTNSATRGGQTMTHKPILSKSQSVEEIRKKNQAVVDDKKKKQDEKLRKAQQLREAQEKEKLEKQRKLLEEKEQRAREKQQLKQQEEALKAAEQKRKEAEREQKRKEVQSKKAAADRKEQEHYLRILAEKKAMQEKLRINKLKAEELKKKNPYNFDMLDSGDSTDDEAKTSSKKPSPPAWSLSQQRKPYIMAQSKSNTKVIDKFFSVAPLEVDLREIFPKIDEKHLRRNSSAVWNSPPRYSMLPKY